MEQDEIICSGCGNYESKCTCHPQGDELLTPEKACEILVDILGLEWIEDLEESNPMLFYGIEEIQKKTAEAQLAKDNNRFLAWLEKHGSQVQVDLFKEETGL